MSAVETLRGPLQTLRRRTSVGIVQDRVEVGLGDGVTVSMVEIWIREVKRERRSRIRIERFTG